MSRHKQTQNKQIDSNLGVDVGVDEEVAVRQQMQERVPVVPGAILIRLFLQQWQRHRFRGRSGIKLVAVLERPTDQDDVPRGQDLRSCIPPLHKQIVHRLTPIITRSRPNEPHRVVPFLVPAHLH